MSQGWNVLEFSLPGKEQSGFEQRGGICIRQSVLVRLKMLLSNPSHNQPV